MKEEVIILRVDTLNKLLSIAGAQPYGRVVEAMEQAKADLANQKMLRLNIEADPPIKQE